jgi:nicotinamidase-related amidase
MEATKLPLLSFGLHFKAYGRHRDRFDKDPDRQRPTQGPDKKGHCMTHTINPDKTALILIGYQNDYFSPDGILYDFLEDRQGTQRVLKNTVRLMDGLVGSGVLIVTTPICFSEDYSELVNPTGILQAIKDVGAFRKGSSGSQTISELEPYRDQITDIPGKRGLNAFMGTDLEKTLRSRGVEQIYLAGAATSICIDSTGRYAFEIGFKVGVLSDCTSGRTRVEQDFYCQNVFPLYASVITHEDLLASVCELKEQI